MLLLAVYIDIAFAIHIHVAFQYYTMLSCSENFLLLKKYWAFEVLTQAQNHAHINLLEKVAHNV